MSTFEIGPGLSCDLDLLIASRLLVQASSGQGKTRTIRRLLEQTHGQVQHLVIDPEGEYHTLREHFDYVLAAPKGGDVVAHPRYAKMLAEELLKLGVSAICDIYELNPDDRRLFVKNFFMALVDAPRELWHPCLVVLDEAHIFCPEKGEAVSAGAVEALSTRGRKRGFCLVAATQRLAKFKKDAAAELANKLIGGTNLDIDVDRGGEELGFPKADRIASLRGLEPGTFWAFGRAFTFTKSHERVVAPVQVKVGGVKSKHPEPGEAAAPTPPPTAKVKAVLSKLSSLPAEAEAQEKSLADLQKENAGLRRQLKAIPTEFIEERVEVPVLRPDERDWFLKAQSIEHDARAMWKAVTETVETYLENYTQIRAAIEGIQRRVDGALKVDAGRVAPNTQLGARERDVKPDRNPKVGALGGAVTRPSRNPASASDGPKKMERAFLTVLAQHREGLSKKQVLAYTGYVRSGSTADAFAMLTREGWIAGDHDHLEITMRGLEVLGPYEDLPVGEELREQVLRKLSKMEQAFLSIVFEAYPSDISKADVLAATNYVRSGSTADAFANLTALDYLVKTGPARVKAADVFFA